MHRVKDHTKYAYFDYNNAPQLTNLLGGVIINTAENEVGIIIQVHEHPYNLEVRTDMWGNCDLQSKNIRPATGSDIWAHRPEIVPELLNQWDGEETNDVDWYGEFLSHFTVMPSGRTAWEDAVAVLNPIDVTLLSPNAAASMVNQKTE